LNLTEKEVQYVADLANLELAPNEIKRLAHDLAEILTHIEQLNELDTANIEPMAQVLFEEDETAALREDVVHKSLTNAEALANAPESGAGYFKVPKVIER
jgi:aspartyl-tRNA(Asn)/glutamyl-tRNA(Gln) amidotransferase subunit C